MPSVRRLTAILAADVAGYSRLMDTLVKEDDPVGVACNLLLQLTRFVAEAGGTAKGAGSHAAWHPTNQTTDDRA